MPDTSLDSLESTLRQLREIVENDHHRESAVIVRQMEQLIAEMKSRDKYKNCVAQESGFSAALAT